MFSADAPPRNCSSSLTESVCPVGRIRSIREVYDREQTRSQALLIDVNHSTLVPLTLPGPPLRFFDPDGTEVTRTHHRRRRCSAPTTTPCPIGCYRERSVYTPRRS